jgi:hypothetical protein
MAIQHRFAVMAIAALAGLSAVPGTRAAPPSPYAGQEQREIKALSPEDVKALEAGEGMGLAKAAELNRYPGPRHVLDLAEPLELSGAQRVEAERIFAGMRSEALRVGQEILTVERELERRFAMQSMTEADLTRLTDTLGRLNGQLRAIHLRTHLRMRDLLTPDQVERYQHLRGYGGPAGMDQGSGIPHHHHP